MSSLASDRLWRCHEPAAVRAAAETVGPTPRIVKGPAPAGRAAGDGPAATGSYNRWAAPAPTP